MRLGIVSGDGLAVSGLLTVARNVLQLGWRLRLINDQDSVPADLGFSWRPDKPECFPDGNGTLAAPDWMEVADWRPAANIDSAFLAKQILAVRSSVANWDDLGDVARNRVRDQSARLSALYEQHFTRWLRQHELDWIIAINMTISDAVSVTSALHRVTREYYAGRPGGVLYWDHDLFASYSVRDLSTGRRLYPRRPGELTSLPAKDAHVRWAVVTDALAEEAASYKTDLVPDVVPNILPVISADMTTRQSEFARQQSLDLRRPILINPVRVFDVKGVDIAVRLLRSMRDHADITGRPVPYLLVFGSLREDPPCAQRVLALARDLSLDGDIRFLDGVPLVSYRDASSRWRLDETDLLGLARLTSGGVVFTPNVPDVESVGLGPALAAAASLPCVITAYNAFDHIYSSAFSYTRTGATQGSIENAAVEFLDTLERFRRRDEMLQNSLAMNKKIVEQTFDTAGWERLLRELHDSLGKG